VGSPASALYAAAAAQCLMLIIATAPPEAEFPLSCLRSSGLVSAPLPFHRLLGFGCYWTCICIPVATLNSGNFGQITSDISGTQGLSAGDPRIVQLALKYVF
jgi:hypothetical protein